MKKIIIILIIIAAFFFGWKIYYSKNIDFRNTSQTEAEKVDLGLLKKTYQRELKVILNNYLYQTRDTSLITEEFVNQTKNSLLALKMPADYKELHLKLVLAMDRMLDYINNNDEGQLQQSQEIIEQAKKDYEWLN